jgi:hypothetical protein
MRPTQITDYARWAQRLRTPPLIERFASMKDVYGAVAPICATAREADT